MNFKETFLRLTEYTIPFGKEDTLYPILKELIPDIKKDGIGNYYYVIGDSETLFTTHLDTYSKKMVKVNHVFDGDWIRTDGKTILGGDNKNGTTILLYMIEQGVPGTYYFFLGEEPVISGGRYGSKSILKMEPDFFKKFKRAVAFDRKQTGSIVTRQSARSCCSNEFADYLIEEFKKQGLTFEKDPGGYYTDTATFLDVIPEITNISAGGWGEHTTKESTLITYTEMVASAATKVNWEDSPVVRVPKKVSTVDEDTPKIDNPELLKITEKTFEKVNMIFQMYGYLCLNQDELSIGVNMVFSHWHQESEFLVMFVGDTIFINGSRVGSFSDFKNVLGIKFEDLVKQEELLEEMVDFMDEYEETSVDFNVVDTYLQSKLSSLEEMFDYMTQNPKSLLSKYIIIDDDKETLSVKRDESEESDEMDDYDYTIKIQDLENKDEWNVGEYGMDKDGKIFKIVE